MKEPQKKYLIFFHDLEPLPLRKENVIATSVGEAISKIKTKYDHIDIHDVEPMGEWISVSKFRPCAHKDTKPPGKSWLVTDGKSVWIDTRHPSWWTENHPFVTHWMPLPKLPIRK